MSKRCDQCSKQHDRKRFCSNACKDRYHNLHNPRGRVLEHERLTIEEQCHAAAMDAIEAGWDGHKDVF